LMQNQSLFLFLNMVALSPIALLCARALEKGLRHARTPEGDSPRYYVNLTGFGEVSPGDFCWVFPLSFRRISAII
jgi:hypothetical protein